MGVNGNRKSSGRRAWYPSGPLLPANDVSSSVSSPHPPPPVTVEPPNPDPTRYQVVRVQLVGVCLVLLIRYHGCTNYEGRKILVFRGITLADLLNQRVIDPHFFEHATIASPVARFVPTEEGWDMAVGFAGSIG